MIRLPLLAKVLRLWLRSGIRGGSRMTRLLARRIPSLQVVPIQIADWPAVYMDLRGWSAQHWLKGSPWESSAREPDEQRILRWFVREGDTVYDIGANIGLHAALLSRLVGRKGHVYAFEPNPALVPALTRTTKHMGNATLFTVALAGEPGGAVLFVSPEDHSLSSLADWTPEQTETREVVCEKIPLDDLIAQNHLPSPSFIKCDVEGGELEVFRGARNLLNQPNAPVVLFEANIHTARGFRQALSAARDFLAELPAPDYGFFDLDKNGNLVPLDELHPTHSNILAVPARAAAREIGSSRL